jgi:hypothetical protein
MIKILAIFALIVGAYFLISPYERCVRESEPKCEDWQEYPTLYKNKGACISQHLVWDKKACEQITHW